MISTVRRLYLKRLSEKIETLKADICKGSLDLERYKALTGELLGYEQSLELFNEILRTVNRDDDLDD